MLKIGVLGIQGGFEEHLQMVSQIGCEAIDVRKPEHIEGLDALILPGGESTTIGLVARDNDLIEPIRKFIHDDKKPVMGTCAGMIVLSENVTDQQKGGQALFGGLDTVVCRNGFGRQINSFESVVDVSGMKDDEQPSGAEVFIRAPIVKKCGPNVEVIATLTHSFKDKCDPNATAAPPSENEQVIVGVRQGSTIALSFHPELTSDTYWHRYFKHVVETCKEGSRPVRS
eukprot:TRINITY_DN9075_c0_g1_i1.p1 TRINITY_DN9075_c0_g1~~TRINITY_DN9075_c0_g1_i1.p1  ORF type:complete len:228 (+),score=53.26 TRINITY_DN9075_c0_g1_i1:73-756(+)